MVSYDIKTETNVQMFPNLKILKMMLKISNKNNSVKGIYQLKMLHKWFRFGQSRSQKEY